ncbi:unnamed protein product [Litomosoides sigmodontis]|uniref:Uncharacterized protein n=1 Tax=Litomosoides sigmodontis TaxID=42156 RepID=A0A3P6T9V6_LITSI|nr:unnamed protein product [Litomosoides sigmodontis]
MGKVTRSLGFNYEISTILPTGLIRNWKITTLYDLKLIVKNFYIFPLLQQHSRRHAQHNIASALQRFKSTDDQMS